MKFSFDHSFPVFNWQFNSEPSGWIHDIYVEKTIHKSPKAPTSSILEMSTILEKTTALHDDPATIGNFVHYLGDHISFPVDKAINYELELKLINCTSRSIHLTPIVNGLPDRQFLSPSHVPILIRLDVALSKRSFDLSFSSSEIKNKLKIEVQSLKLTSKPLKENSTTNIFLASDSTVQTYTETERPQYGWGEYLARMISITNKVLIKPDHTSKYPQATNYYTDNFIVHNRSIGGRSSKSFINEGKLRDLLFQLTKGDFLLIQWGDNDATSIRPMRYVSPIHFEKYLNEYIDGALDREVTPILVTPPSRYNFANLDHAEISFKEYRSVMLDVAHKRKVAIIDLGLLSNNFINEMGKSNSQLVYMKLPSNLYANFPEGLDDATHLQSFGAKHFANLVATKLKPLLKISELTTSSPYIQAQIFEKTQKRGINLSWQPVSTAVDFYTIKAYSKKHHLVINEYITDLTHYFINLNDSIDDIKYQVYANVNDNCIKVNEISLTHIFNSIMNTTHTISGVNIYELDTDTIDDKISFSVRFNPFRSTHIYKIMLLNQKNGQSLVLDHISAKKVAELHSYTVNKASNLEILIIGLDINNQIIAESKIVSVTH
jgi:lysophospholipase L1-like esterase